MNYLLVYAFSFRYFLYDKAEYGVFRNVIYLLNLPDEKELKKLNAGFTLET